MGSLTKATTETFAQGGVNSTNINDGSITNAKIASNAAIASSKLDITFPTISSLSITNGQPAVYDTETVDINGTDFTNGASVEFIHSTNNTPYKLSTVTYVSATQLRVTVPASTLTEGTDYKVRVENPNGLAAISTSTVLYSQNVSFSTASGSLGSVGEGESASFSVSASSNSSITYSITSGSLPSGLSLNSSTGAITGTAPTVSADTTSTFTITATDAESQTASRSFSITVTDFAIANSLRFNSADSADLTFTLGTPTSQQKFTESFWLKRGLTGGQRLFKGAGTDNTNKLYYGFNSDQLNLINTESGGANNLFLKPNAYYRDYSAWYHVVLSVDTTQATSSDRAKLYVNGEQVTDFATALYPPLNHNFVYYASGTQIQIGDGYHATAFFYDGYMAEVNFIDGQALSPTDFGETDSTTNNWIPKKYTGSYGTNGFYLKFSNSGSLGADSSGNSNTFTANNLAAVDQTTDTPTNNFATLNPINNPAGSTLSEGNCKAVTTVGTSGKVVGTIGASSGKWYCEVQVLSTNNISIGIVPTSVSDTNVLGDLSTEYGYLATSGTKYSGGSASAYGSTYTNGDIIGVALDLDAGTLIFYKNGASQGTAFTGISGEYTFGFSDSSGSNSTTGNINFGNPAFSISSGNTDENGYGNFEYEPPSGYLALCTNNLPNVTIADPTEHFNTVLYSGNSTTNRTVTGVGFQPDFTWFKGRTSSAIDHALFDSNRGATKILISNNNNAEITVSESLKSFDSDGVTLGNDLGDYGVNNSARTYALWSWKANGGTTSSNTDGNITSTVQANTTAGFSIVTYTGNGNASTQTVGHGLGSKCKVVILRNRADAGQSWRVYHDSVSASAGGNLFLNGSGILDTGDPARVTATSTSTFSLLGYTSPYNAVNNSGSNYLAYCFAEIEGYSKFGKYTGNGSTDGIFVYTGFKPAFVIIKVTSTTENWVIRDNKRDPYNNVYHQLLANASSAEDTTNDGRFSQDFLSNGFKIRASHATTNQNGATYIYMAFAEAPFKYGTGATSVEGTAR